jgi:hypothetical protein
MKMCAWLKAATRRVVRLCSAPLPKTSPDMSPIPAIVKGWLWMSRPRLAKWCFTHSQHPRAVIPTFLWSYPWLPPEANASPSQKPYWAETLFAVSDRCAVPLSAATTR